MLSRTCSDDESSSGANQRTGRAHGASEGEQRGALLGRVRVDRPRATADLGRRIAGRQQAQEPLRERHRLRPLQGSALLARWH